MPFIDVDEAFDISVAVREAPRRRLNKVVNVDHLNGMMVNVGKCLTRRLELQFRKLRTPETFDNKVITTMIIGPLDGGDRPIGNAIFCCFIRLIRLLQGLIKCKRASINNIMKRYKQEAHRLF